MFTEEANSRTEHFDRYTTFEMLQIINDEDQKVALVVKQALPHIAQAVDAIVAAFAQGGRLIYVGAGTSGRLGVLDAVECLPTFSASPDLIVGLIAGGNTAMVHSAEGAEDRSDLGEADVRGIGLNARDVLVGIAASGTTPYVLGALRYGSEVGAVTVGISCNDPAPVLDLAQIKIALPVGPEVITGSTRMKAGTAQKMTLNMISTAAMARSGKVYGNRMVDVRVTNDKLRRRACRILEELTGVDEATARELLAAANNNAKVAIVMQRRAVDAETARRLLQEAHGFLRPVIDG
ncbi:MAG: N-acetylmuramic acid 6-phosphate etherase [Anaerolineae bacterium]|nr:N-acetylmuramic acid 6-phosphate etherase [Anaerolineae bacterium]